MSARVKRTKERLEAARLQDENPEGEFIPQSWRLSYGVRMFQLELIHGVLEQTLELYMDMIRRIVCYDSEGRQPASDLNITTLKEQDQERSRIRIGDPETGAILVVKANAQMLYERPTEKILQ